MCSLSRRGPLKDSEEGETARAKPGEKDSSHRGLGPLQDQKANVGIGRLWRQHALECLKIQGDSGKQASTTMRQCAGTGQRSHRGALCPGSTPPGKALNLGQHSNFCPWRFGLRSQHRLQRELRSSLHSHNKSDKSTNPRSIFFFFLFHLSEHVWTFLVIKSCPRCFVANLTTQSPLGRHSLHWRTASIRLACGQ